MFLWPQGKGIIITNSMTISNKRVASRLGRQLKTCDLKKLGNIGRKYYENFKILWNDSVVLSLAPKIKILQILAKNS